MSAQINTIRPEFDREIVDIVDYVMNKEITYKVAYDTAHYCLLDTLRCGILAIEDRLSRNAVASGKAPLTMIQVLTAMIKAH